MKGRVFLEMTKKTASNQKKSDVYRESLELHERKQGKLEIRSKVPLRTRKDLARGVHTRGSRGVQGN